MFFLPLVLNSHGVMDTGAPGGLGGGSAKEGPAAVTAAARTVTNERMDLRVFMIRLLNPEKVCSVLWLEGTNRPAPLAAATSAARDSLKADAAGRVGEGPLLRHP